MTGAEDKCPLCEAIVLRSVKGSARPWVRYDCLTRRFDDGTIQRDTRCYERQIARLEQELTDSRMESEQLTDLLNDAREELERTQHQRDGLQQRLEQAEQERDSFKSLLEEVMEDLAIASERYEPCHAAPGFREATPRDPDSLDVCLETQDKIRAALTAPKPEGGTEEEAK